MSKAKVFVKLPDSTATKRAFCVQASSEDVGQELIDLKLKSLAMKHKLREMLDVIYNKDTRAQWPARDIQEVSAELQVAKPEQGSSSGLNSADTRHSACGVVGV